MPLPSTGSADLTPGSAIEVHPLRAADVAAVTAAMPGLPYAPTNKHEERLGLQNAGSATYLIAWQGGEPVGHVLVRSSPVSENSRSDTRTGTSSAGTTGTRSSTGT